MPFYTSPLSKRGKLAHAITLAIADEPKPRSRPLFDSADATWQEAMRLSAELSIPLTDAYDRVRGAR